MSIPQQIRAGDSVSWLDAMATDNLGNAIASSEWALTYVLRGSTGLTLTATADGNGWKTTITAAQSAQLVPGTYHWQAYATKATERVTIATGTVEVLENLAFSGTAAAFDGRSQAQQDLEAVQAAMRALVSGGAVQEYSIGSRSLKKMAMADLIALESKLKADVVREKRREKLAAGVNGRAVFVRF